MLKEVQKFPRCSSNKVLPLVYDDSLSYYEVNCKLVNKVNELIESINTGLGEYIRAELQKLFIDSSYDETTETLTLQIKVGE